MLLAGVKQLRSVLAAGRQDFSPGFCGDPYDWEQPRDTLKDAVEASKAGVAFDHFVTGFRQVAAMPA
jgi:hypothetical protein